MRGRAPMRIFVIKQTDLLWDRLGAKGNSRRWALVRTAGVEPARPEGQEILSLQRLPFRHVRMRDVRQSEVPRQRLS